MNGYLRVMLKFSYTKLYTYTYKLRNFFFLLLNELQFFDVARKSFHVGHPWYIIYKLIYIYSIIYNGILSK